MANTIKALRSICEECTNVQNANKTVNGQPLRARDLTEQASADARLLQILTAQTLSEGLVSIKGDVIDGIRYTHHEFLPATVNSRATGGLDKFSCGFDPTIMEYVSKDKELTTEFLYQNIEECMPEKIGSILHASRTGGNNGIPVAFRDGQNITSIAASTDLLMEYMIYNFVEMARVIDGTNIFGDFTGGVAPTDSENYIGSQYPHYDGVLKQALQNNDYIVYAQGKLKLPTLAAGGMYFAEIYGNVLPFSDVDTLLAGLNSYVNNVTREYPFTAWVDALGDINLVSNEPEKAPYGNGILRIFAIDSGVWDSQSAGCETPVPYTVVKAPMSLVEQSEMFDWNERITAANIHDYFVEKINKIRIAWMKQSAKKRTNWRSLLNTSSWYIAIDPILYNMFNLAKLEELCGCQNGDAKLEALQSLFPRFVPVDVMMGTDIWFASFQSNLLFLTDIENQRLGTTSIWYDKDCKTVKMRNEMLANILVLDFSKFSSNACNSVFHKGLHNPYKPKNIPHISACRADGAMAVKDTNLTTVAPEIEVSTTDGIEYILKANSNIVLASGDSVASVVWGFQMSDSTTPVEPATQSESIELSLTEAEYNKLLIAFLTVTTTNGEVIEKTIIKSKFTNNIV